MSRRTKESKSKTPTEVRVAFVTGAFAVIAAAVTGVFLLAKKDPAPKPAPPSPPIVLTNHITVPLVPAAPGKLELQHFALNEQDSLYRICPPNDCTFPGRPGSDIPFWAPKPEARMALNLQHGMDLWSDTDVPVGDARYVGFERKYRADPGQFLNRLLPTFDLIVTNSALQPIVLTSIEVVVSRSSPFAQGDAEERSTASHLLPILHRYELRIPEKYSEYERPFRFSVSALPPLSVQANDPARFQVSIDSSAPAAWLYEMRLKLHFGPNKALTTEKFGLKL